MATWAIVSHKSKHSKDLEQARRAKFALSAYETKTYDNKKKPYDIVRKNTFDIQEMLGKMSI